MTGTYAVLEKRDEKRGVVEAFGGSAGIRTAAAMHPRRIKKGVPPFPWGWKAANPMPIRTTKEEVATGFPEGAPDGPFTGYTQYEGRMPMNPFSAAISVALFGPVRRSRQVREAPE